MTLDKNYFCGILIDNKNLLSRQHLNKFLPQDNAHKRVVSTRSLLCTSNPFFRLSRPDSSLFRDVTLPTVTTPPQGRVPVLRPWSHPRQVFDRGRDKNGGTEVLGRTEEYTEKGDHESLTSDSSFRTPPPPVWVSTSINTTDHTSILTRRSLFDLETWSDRCLFLPRESNPSFTVYPSIPCTFKFHFGRNTRGTHSNKAAYLYDLFTFLHTYLLLLFIYSFYL